MAFSADTFIALGALLISAISAFHSVRTSNRQTKLQEQLAAYQLRAHKAAEERSKRADVRISLEWGPDRFVLANVGEARALDVRLEVEAQDYTGAISEAELRRKVPISVLDPRREVAFGALVIWEHSPAFDVRVMWNDIDGTPRRLETVLYG